uniref:Uncharacterized protein n=1 Tax=Tanacetum cinerariifolium TaxID=118510 RepID=A0A6L2N7J7_TANCI|nr:hypothetical protein [Tanacetum cinerariifolium]
MGSDTTFSPADVLPAASVPTVSGSFPTVSAIFTTASVEQKIMEEEFARENQRLSEQLARDSEIARLHAEEELKIMIKGHDRSNEVIAKHLSEFEQAEADLFVGEKIELISEMVKYQDHRAKILKYHAQQSKPLSRTNRCSDFEDQLWTHRQAFMHDPLDWKLYDTCGLHHVSTKDQEIFMLVEKDYPLRKGLATVMINRSTVPHTINGGNEEIGGIEEKRRPYDEEKDLFNMEGNRIAVIDECVNTFEDEVEPMVTQIKENVPSEGNTLNYFNGEGSNNGEVPSPQSILKSSTIQIGDFHEKTKHLEIDIQLVREKVSFVMIKTVKVTYVDDISYGFTKG